MRPTEILADVAMTCSFERIVVAVNYAMTRTFPKPEYHLFYDAGAGSVKATVVEFSTRQVQADSVLSIGSTQRDAVVVDVKGVGWDRSVGGLALDELLRGHLANDFQTRSGSKLETPVTQNKRAMAKLMREANRVKHILSANAQSSAAVEGLAEDVDFRYKVTREEFEELAKEAGFLERFAKPVQDALENAGLKIVS